MIILFVLSRKLLKYLITLKLQYLSRKCDSKSEIRTYPLVLDANFIDYFFLETSDFVITIKINLLGFTALIFSCLLLKFI